MLMRHGARCCVNQRMGHDRICLRTVVSIQLMFVSVKVEKWKQTFDITIPVNSYLLVLTSPSQTTYHLMFFIQNSASFISVPNARSLFSFSTVFHHLIRTSLSLQMTNKPDRSLSKSPAMIAHWGASASIKSHHPVFTNMLGTRKHNYMHKRR